MRILSKLFLSSIVSLHSVVWAECDSTVAATTPTERFTEMSNPAILKDANTGLQWQRCALGATWTKSAGCSVTDGAQGEYTWGEALVAAQNGWRLPNKKELTSIIEYQCRLPALNSQLFPLDSEAMGAVFWTSTPLIYFSQATVWGIDFADGAFVNRPASERLQVRLVRD